MIQKIWFSIPQGSATNRNDDITANSSWEDVHRLLHVCASSTYMSLEFGSLDFFFSHYRCHPTPRVQILLLDLQLWCTAWRSLPCEVRKSTADILRVFPARQHRTPRWMEFVEFISVQSPWQGLGNAVDGCETLHPSWGNSGIPFTLRKSYGIFLSIYLNWCRISQPQDMLFAIDFPRHDPLQMRSSNHG